MAVISNRSAVQILRLLRDNSPHGSGRCVECRDYPVALWDGFCVNCWRDQLAILSHCCDDDCRSDGCQFRESDDYHGIVHADLFDIDEDMLARVSAG